MKTEKKEKQILMLSFLSGGNLVNHIQVSLFHCCLGVASIIIFILIKRLNRNLSSPTIEAELLGWKLYIAYSMGMALAFFLSMYLKKHLSLLSLHILTRL